MHGNSNIKFNVVMLTVGTIVRDGRVMSAECNYTLSLNFNLLKTTIVAPPSNASKWQMGFNSALKGLNMCQHFTPHSVQEAVIAF